jgi:hypothetical protein
MRRPQVVGHWHTLFEGFAAFVLVRAMTGHTPKRVSGTVLSPTVLSMPITGFSFTA